MPTFVNDGLKLHYTERGSGRPMVLLHGLMWSARMFERLAMLLPGERIVMLDLRGHGKSDRPTDPSPYTWAGFTSDVIATLDHLGIDRAVIGGLSLGANVALVTAMHHPDRCAGLVLEMPVLAHSESFGRRFFDQLINALTVGRPVIKALGTVIGKIPSSTRIPELVALRDVTAVEPDSAVAIIRGLLDEELPPPERDTLAALTMPALVIGHHRDPLHVVDDARDLAANLPDGRFLEASSFLEFRLRPDRLADALRGFLEDVWSATPTA